MTITICKQQEKTYLGMFLSKKYFIYYHRVSTQEGLNIDLNTSEFMLGNYNKEIY